jgi:hypothetical protein
VNHAYDTDRDYTISLSCFDNYGATSIPPASVSANFDYQKRQAVLAEANRKADEIKQKANEEAERVKAAAQQEVAAAKNAEEKAKQAQKAATQEKADAQKVQEEAQKEREDAARKLNEAKAFPVADNSNKPPVSLPASDPTLPPNDGDSQASKRHPDTDGRKGGQLMIDRQYEIVKAGTGQFWKDGKLQVMLVVRDRSFPNSSIDVQEWQANERSYKSGNAQLTIDLPVGEYIVRALVRRSGEDPRWQKAKVTVSADLHQSTEPHFTVTNF